MRMPYLRHVMLALSMLLAAGPARARAAEDLALKSTAVLVVDQETGESLISKNADVVMPIASLTKLMTAMVVIGAQLPMDEVLEIDNDDVDREKHTASRLAVGTRLSRANLLLLALMASENRAAMALSRGYPGGRTAFIARMNETARSLGMNSTRFADPAGLSSQTVSTARDLLRLVSAADTQDLIRRDSTQAEGTVLVRGRPLTFVNTNRMVRYPRDWDIGLQKTGFTNEAGRCLVMRATTLNRKLSMVFLNSIGTMTRFADATRVRRRLELQASGRPLRSAEAATATAVLP
ncbi:MAG: hypothetical protein JWQ90_2668 [Hydrocarboniphaga sp.]|nr:hypothetical protein [Hydrocarboniphaga sp.]